MRTSLLLCALLSVPSVLPAEDHEAHISPEPATWSPAKRAAAEWVDANWGQVDGMSKALWRLAEPGMLEYRSAQLLTEVLEEAGFTVERGVAGMPTAFTARFGTGEPVIGILAEYDALGGLSQNPVARPDPRVPGGPGQGCGHSLFGAGSVGAALAVAHAIEAGHAKGTVVLFGTPNEEGVVGKAFMARDGAYSGLDACLHWHPSDENEVPTGETGNDLTSFMVAFYGETAHSAGAPWKGRSALDAVELMGVMSNYYREHLHPSARIHYVIMEGGDAPNVVPAFAKAWFYLRGGTREMVDEMYERMQKIAEAAALATGTRHELRLFTSINHLRNNTAGAKVMHANLQLIGPPEFTDAEQDFAKAIQREIGRDESGMATGIEPLEPATERDLDAYIGQGSTDVAEVSLITADRRAGHGVVRQGHAGPPLGQRGVCRPHHRREGAARRHQGAGRNDPRPDGVARDPGRHAGGARGADRRRALRLVDPRRRAARRAPQPLREPDLGAGAPRLPDVEVVRPRGARRGRPLSRG